jgi:hypothetical protein
MDRVAGNPSAACAVRAISRVIGAASALSAWRRGYGKERSLDRSGNAAQLADVHRGQDAGHGDVGGRRWDVAGGELAGGRAGGHFPAVEEPGECGAVEQDNVSQARVLKLSADSPTVASAGRLLGRRTMTSPIRWPAACSRVRVKCTHRSACVRLAAVPASPAMPPPRTRSRIVRRLRSYQESAAQGRSQVRRMQGYGVGERCGGERPVYGGGLASGGTRQLRGA